MRAQSPRTPYSALAGVSLLALAALTPASLAQNEAEIGAMPDINLQSQISTARALDRLRFLAGIEQETGTSVFATVLDNRLDFDTQPGLAGFETETRGGLVGFESRLDNGFTLGAALSRQSGNVRHPSQGGSAYRDTALHLFSRYDLGGLQWGVSGDYGRSRYSDVYRAIGAAPGSVTGDTKGNYWRIGTTLSMDFVLDNGVRLSPVVGYDYFHTVVNAFDETGNAAAQRSFQRQSINTQRITAGVNVELPGWQMGRGVTLVPVGDLTYGRTLSGDAHTLRATGGAGALNLTSPGYLDSGFDGSLGAELRFDSGWALGANYSHAFSGDNQGSRTIGVSLRRRF